jgi:DNA polymerase-3 subunit alpha
VLEKDEEGKTATEEAPVLEQDAQDDNVDLAEIVSDDVVAGEEEVMEEVTKKLSQR